MDMPDFFESGFSVRTPSWHKRESVLDEYPENWDDARRAAGLMWEPTYATAWGERLLTEAQIAALPPDQVRRIVTEGLPAQYRRPDAKVPVMVAEPENRRIVRDDTGETLAVMADSYSLITHAQMGELIEAFLDTDGNVKFETAGSVRDGKQVWALVRLDEPYQVPGDPSATYPYLAMLNAHDGSASCSMTCTDVRVVCWNTWTRADQQGKANGTRLVLRHSGNITERLAQVKDGIRAMRTEAARNRELFTQLAQVPVRTEQVMDFTERFLPSPRENGEVCTDRVHENVVRARGTFGRLYEQSETTEGVRGTAYGLLMASTEYLDHIRVARTDDSYLGRTILRPERAKEAALALIGEVTGN
jgi:phage/plasmid-like protein (TIGR03299 family)